MICFGQSFGFKTTNVVINVIIVVNDLFKQFWSIIRIQNDIMASLLSGIIVMNDLFCSIINADFNFRILQNFAKFAKFCSSEYLH